MCSLCMWLAEGSVSSAVLRKVMMCVCVCVCERERVCGAHSCPWWSSLLLFLPPWSWHWCEYPEDDVTASTAGQTLVQSQAQFPQRPVKHQNNLLSNCACVWVFGGTLWHLPVNSHGRAIQVWLNWYYEIDYRFIWYFLKCYERQLSKSHYTSFIFCGFGPINMLNWPQSLKDSLICG